MCPLTVLNEYPVACAAAVIDPWRMTASRVVKWTTDKYIEKPHKDNDAIDVLMWTGAGAHREDTGVRPAPTTQLWQLGPRSHHRSSRAPRERAHPKSQIASGPSGPEPWRPGSRLSKAVDTASGQRGNLWVAARRAAPDQWTLSLFRESLDCALPAQRYRRC